MSSPMMSLFALLSLVLISGCFSGASQQGADTVVWSFYGLGFLIHSIVIGVFLILPSLCLGAILDYSFSSENKKLIRCKVALTWP